jgi:hypothetical protein
MSELFSLMGLGQRSWVDAAMLLSLFWVAIMRPERIRSHGEFRAACILLTISILAPAMINIVAMNTLSTGFNRGMAGMGGGGNMEIGMYLHVVPAALLAFSFFLGIDSITPRAPASDGRPPMPPPAAER